MRGCGADDGLDKLHKLQLRVLPHHAQSIGSVGDGPCALSRRVSLATSTLTLNLQRRPTKALTLIGALRLTALIGALGARAVTHAPHVI